MKIFRQLGSCGTEVVLLPLFWIAACFLGRMLAQNAYDHQITAQTRAYRLVELPILQEGAEVDDRLALAELQKYVRVWSLEPGACAEFPSAARFPWSWNPLFGSAAMMRLKQKQSFLQSQHHEVHRQSLGPEHFRFYIQPDKEAALGGRRFAVDVQGGSIKKPGKEMKLPLLYNVRAGTSRKDPDALMARLPEDHRARIEPSPSVPLRFRAVHRAGQSRWRTTLCLGWRWNDSPCRHRSRRGGLSGASGGGSRRQRKWPCARVAHALGTERRRAAIVGRPRAAHGPTQAGWRTLLNLCGTGFEAAIAHDFHGGTSRAFSVMPSVR